jgi:hypothetical protein
LLPATPISKHQTTKVKYNFDNFFTEPKFYDEPVPNFAHVLLDPHEDEVLMTKLHSTGLKPSKENQREFQHRLDRFLSD